MKKKYFGTDGIRGRVNKFPITKEFVYKIAIALKLFKKNTKNVLVGKDTRISGSLIEKALRSRNADPDKTILTFKVYELSSTL